jgi:hypothetical protein
LNGMKVIKKNNNKKKIIDEESKFKKPKNL